MNGTTIQHQGKMLLDIFIGTKLGKCVSFISILFGCSLMFRVLFLCDLYLTDRSLAYIRVDDLNAPASWLKFCGLVDIFIVIVYSLKNYIRIFHYAEYKEFDVDGETKWMLLISFFICSSLGHLTFVILQAIYYFLLANDSDIWHSPFPSSYSVEYADLYDPGDYSLYLIVLGAILFTTFVHNLEYVAQLCSECHTEMSKGMNDLNQSPVEKEQ